MTGPVPIDGVLFDFHSTLVDQGDPHHWLDLAVAHAGAPALGDEQRDELATWINRMWEHGRDLDPHSERDLSRARHREVYDVLVRRAPHMTDALAEGLYTTMLEPWLPYDDALPTLTALRERGIRTALVSNAGIDVRWVLSRTGMDDLLDAVVISYEAGAVKPAAEIFRAALTAIDVPAERALMVGDSWQDDAGAAALGIRTLLLPRTTGERHGLALVLRLVGGG